MRQNIVLLHGLFGQLSNWQTVAAYFGPAHNIHIPVLPIYECGPGERLEQLTNYLAAYVEQHQLNNVVLVGNSLGGHVAILYAAKYAHNVSGLVLTGSSGLYENTGIGTYPGRNNPEYIKQRVAYIFHNPAMATEQLVSEVLDITRNTDKCLSMLRMAKSTQRNYVADLLPHIAIPTLLIWGKEDRITPLHVAYEFETMLRQAQLIVFDQCGHVPMMEKSADFNSALETYLITHGRN
jgi:pimeloyl-ACP methyl ester carboxylesterase